MELEVRFRHYGVVVPGDSDDPELAVLRSEHCGELGKFHVYERGVLFKTENGHLELSMGEIHRVHGCGPLEELRYLGSGDLLRIEHHVDAHLREKVFVFVGKVFLVVDPGAYLRAAKLLCEQGAHHVDILA